MTSGRISIPNCKVLGNTHIYLPYLSIRMTYVLGIVSLFTSNQKYGHEFPSEYLNNEREICVIFHRGPVNTE